jgi:F1-F0 ATPase (N-ATPase) AtpR subunit
VDSLLLLDTLQYIPFGIALAVGALLGWLFCVNLRWAVTSMLSRRQPARIIALTALLRIAITIGAITAIALGFGGIYAIPAVLTFIISRRIYTSIYVHNEEPELMLRAKAERRT